MVTLDQASKAMSQGFRVQGFALRQGLDQIAHAPVERGIEAHRLGQSHDRAAQVVNLGDASGFAIIQHR